MSDIFVTATRRCALGHRASVHMSVPIHALTCAPNMTKTSAVAFHVTELAVPWARTDMPRRCPLRDQTLRCSPSRDRADGVMSVPSRGWMLPLTWPKPAMFSPTWPSRIYIWILTTLLSANCPLETYGFMVKTHLNHLGGENLTESLMAPYVKPY